MIDVQTFARKHKRFISKIATPLKQKAKLKSGYRPLSFQASRRASIGPHYLWDVPASGGYFGGYETGEAMALSFLKHLRSEKSISHALLTDIAQSFMVQFERQGGKAMINRPGWHHDGFESLRGQYVGFFNTLLPWLQASSKSLGKNLDNMTDRELLRRANSGLGFDQAAYVATLSDDEYE